MTRRHKLAIGILLSGLFLNGCSKTPADEASAPVPEVTLATVQMGELTQELTVGGNLAALPNQDAKVSALVPGRIKAVSVTEGDRVATGQQLAQLDSSSLNDQLRQAEAAVSQAQANLNNAKLSADRNEGLLQRGIASRKEVEDARTQVSVDEAALRQAEAAASAAQTQLGRTSVRAPFDGTIVRRFLGVGEQVDGSGSQPIVELANIDTLELLGTVPASRLSEIKMGEDFTVNLDALPDHPFHAKVVAVLPAVDPATNNGTVRIRFDNRGHLLKLGMFVTVELPLTHQAKRLLVPRQAVYPDESGEPHLYRVVGDQAESIAVELGIQNKDQVEILSGAAPGDKVILTGGYGLPEKSKVRIKQ